MVFILINIPCVVLWWVLAYHQKLVWRAQARDTLCKHIWQQQQKDLLPWERYVHSHLIHQHKMAGWTPFKTWEARGMLEYINKHCWRKSPTRGAFPLNFFHPEVGVALGQLYYHLGVASFYLMMGTLLTELYDGKTHTHARKLSVLWDMVHNLGWQTNFACHAWGVPTPSLVLRRYEQVH